MTYCSDDVTPRPTSVGGNTVDPVLLASTWPTVAARLCAALRVRGVPRSDRDDIVQEVAARLLSARPVFTSPDELYGWARVVGLRLSIADHRRTKRLSSVEMPERADPVDVDREVQGRLLLERVLREMESLSSRDRAAIGYELLGRPSHWDRPETLRWKVQRHRARERLRQLVEGAGGAVVWLRQRWRELVRLAEPAVSSPLVAAAASWLVPVVATALLPLAAVAPVRPADERRTVDVDHGRTAASVGAPHLGGRTRQRSAATDRVVAPAPGRSSSPPRTPPTTVVWVDDPGGVAGGGATRNDDDELKVCTEGFGPEVPDGCIVSVTPWTVLPSG